MPETRSGHARRTSTTRRTSAPCSAPGNRRRTLRVHDQPIPNRLLVRRMTANDPGFHATDIATGGGRDPYPEYIQLREHTPVARQESMFEGSPSYLVYRHADV